MSIVLIVCSIFFSRESVFQPLRDVEAIQLEPAEIVQVDRDQREYSLMIEPGDGRDSLVFYTSHQYVEVYEGDVCIYALEGSTSIFGSSTGAHWNYVMLAPETREVLVRVVAVYPSERNSVIEFYQGNSLKMVIRRLQDSMPEIGVSITDFILGIILLIYYMLVRKKMDLGPAMGYFGLFAIMMGLWSLNETEAMKILFTDRTAASYLGYVVILLMIAPFAAYLQAFLEVPDKRISNALCLASILNFVVCTILHMTGLLPFKRTIAVGHFLMFCDLLYLFYALVGRIRRVGYDRKARSSILGLVILSASFVLDISAFYLGAVRTDVIGRVCFLLYICILGKEAAAGTLEKLDEGRKAEIYKELAIKDLLTGLYNRNAYDEWAGEHWKDEGVAVLAFDLNDLKKCNDTQGHAAGDKYLQDAADILAKAFEPVGKCFRIGGDEFCAVLERADEAWIRERLRHMERLESEYNRTSDLVYMQIASGYAMFDPQKDSDVEETRGRADALMYENKKNLKGEHT